MSCLLYRLDTRSPRKILETDIDTFNTALLSELNIGQLKVLEMPSTRKQKVKEKRSGDSDMMSDIENLDMILGNLSENSLVEGHENERSEIGTASAGLQENTNTLVEVFSNSRGNSEITAKTIGIPNEELSSQISRKTE